MTSKDTFAYLLHFKFLVLCLVLCNINDYVFSFGCSSVQTFLSVFNECVSDSSCVYDSISSKEYTIGR